LAEETSGWILYFPSDDDERQSEDETLWRTNLLINGNDGGLAHFGRRPLTMEVKSWGRYEALLCEAGGQSAEQCAARTYRYITAVGLNGYPRARGDNHPFVNVIPTNICEFLETRQPPQSDDDLLEDIADVRAVASTHASTCAVHGDGRVTCWGDQRGWGSGSGNCEFASPRLLDEVSDVVAIRAEERSFIARRADGQIYLWGEVPETWSSQADGRFQCDRELQPPTLAALNEPAEEIAAATCTHCLRDRNDRVFCRGLVDGVYEGPGWKNHPALVDIAELSKASQDVHHLCARHHDDSLRCWGRALSASAYERGSRLNPYRLREPQHISRFVAP
jgi:hypothetical protein